MASDAFRFLIPLLAAAALLAFAGSAWLALLAVLLAAFVCYFFRNPRRTIPSGPKLVVAPADGKIVKITEVGRAGEGGNRLTQVSIFLNIFDVHINRAPLAGRIVDVAYHKGAFLPAFDHKASLSNEQNCVTIDGRRSRVAFKQIAGLIARRIVFRKRVGDNVARGERVGLIKFGSRVDLFLPRETVLRVAVGDRGAGGVTVIGELPVGAR